MTPVGQNLQAVRARIDAAGRSAGRSSDSVALLAVSKTWPAQAVRDAYVCGQRAFGENYAQEGVDKIAALRDLPDLVWHFIGPLQSNKTGEVAQAFHWVHSIDRLKIAQRLSQQRPADLPPLQICLQVNVSGEASKSGVAPAALEALAQEVARLPRLALRGLMAIPEASDDLALLRTRFARLRELKDLLNTRLPVPLDTLSMGMSHDLEAAIAEGATLVRVGSAIFGARSTIPSP